jgi:hypothetical protein
MEIKLKLNEVININTVIKNIISDKNIELDSLTKFKFLGIINSLKGHIENFEVIRNEKILEYGKDNEEGQKYIDAKDTETLKKFSEELSAILNSEVTVNIEKIKIDNIFDKGISIDYLTVLYPIMEE